MEEATVLKYIKEKPRATQKEIAINIGKSERTVKYITVILVAEAFNEPQNKPIKQSFFLCG